MYAMLNGRKLFHPELATDGRQPRTNAWMEDGTPDSHHERRPNLDLVASSTSRFCTTFLCGIRLLLALTVPPALPYPSSGFSNLSYCRQRN